MNQLPAHLPQTPDAAGAYINGVVSPTLDDLKLMVFLEASGPAFYNAFADAAPSAAIRALMARNGQEELAHAHRVSRAIKTLHGVDFAVPAPEDNPFYIAPTGIVVTKEMLDFIAEAEFAGDALYERWANSLTDAEAVRLLRQNGKEEKQHGERLREIVGLP